MILFRLPRPDFSPATSLLAAFSGSTACSDTAASGSAGLTGSGSLMWIGSPSKMARCCWIRSLIIPAGMSDMKDGSAEYHLCYK